MEYVLIIDQGTTSTRAIAYDLKGNQICMSKKEFKQLFPKELYVEQDLADVIRTVEESILEIINTLGTEIIALGIANQRESTVLFGKDAKQLYNVISWQDRRTTTLCNQLKSAGLEEKIYKKTGLKLDPCFSASKIYWLLHNVHKAFDKALRKEIFFGTMDTYLLYYLSAGKIFKTDVTNASRTMLYNIYTKAWDNELCKIFDVQKEMLAEVCPSRHFYGKTSKSSIFKKEIPILGVIGDQQASLFGHLCLNQGDAKITFGEGCFLLANINSPKIVEKSKLITSVGAMYDNNFHYIVEGSVFYAGSLIKWLKEDLNILSTEDESEKIAFEIENSKGVYVIPSFIGMGAPHWMNGAKGVIFGLGPDVTKKHIIRAALESISYRVNDIIRQMENENQMKISQIYADGGASKNNFLMQFTADILDTAIIRPKNIEITALGAFYLVALELKLYNSIEEIKIASANKKSDIFKASITNSMRDSLLEDWQKRIRMVLEND